MNAEASRGNSARLRLRITAAAESALRAGHPWVYGESIREQNREGQVGELAVVYDRRDRFLALGLFDPESPIRFRVLQARKPQEIDSNWWGSRLDSARARRSGLFDKRTTGFRWVNGESDGWPGLVLDRYDRTLVLKLYTAAWLPRLEGVLAVVREQLNPERIVLRLSRNIQRIASCQFSRTDGDILHGRPPADSVVFLETGIRFEADVMRGQKTGFFLDQRENRRRVAALAAGRTVLNAFSFSGGFSLYAAQAGAPAVTDIDISPHALEAARRNFALNRKDQRIASCTHELIQADVFDWLAGQAGRNFNLVILDPPSLAKREAERGGAIRAYGRLAAMGLTHLSKGGVLVACSCSAHVSADEFFGAVRATAKSSGRRFHEMETARHAPDHPVAFREADYLKAIYLEF